MILASFLNGNDDVGFRHLISKWLCNNGDKGTSNVTDFPYTNEQNKKELGGNG